MEDITLNTALREQFRTPDAYLEQVGNVLFGLFRLLGWWVAMTVTYTSGAAILAFITTDLSMYSQSDLQESLRIITTFSGGVAALACLLANTGRFHDVFTARAVEKVNRFEAAKSQVQSQVRTTEGVLVKHGLITEADREGI